MFLYHCVILTLNTRSEIRELVHDHADLQHAMLIVRSEFPIHSSLPEDPLAHPCRNLSRATTSLDEVST